MDIDPASLSLAQKVALLPEEQRDEIMADMNPDDLLHDWSFWARPNQMPPTGAWGTWLYMAGRGCISGDTEIDLANGGTVRADEAHRTGMPLRLLSLHDDGTIKPTWGTPPYVKGTAEIWMVALDDGRTIAVTDHHRFLTPQGWQPLAALGPGSVIATAANRATEEKTPPSPTLPRYSQQIATGPDPAWLTSLPSVAWIGIERIERRGEEEFYDLTVPGTANYLANFIIHANSGKTRTASEWIHQRVREGKAKRILLLGRTSADVRDVMINGEALALDTSVPTPTGWTTMGELRRGDEVIGGDGRPCRVLQAYKVLLDRSCYRVTFKSGASVIADADHKWATWDWPARVARSQNRQKTKHVKKVRTTEEIADTVWYRGQCNHAVEVTGSWFPATEDLPLDPYTFGVWLGDGANRGNTVTLNDTDAEYILQRITRVYSVTQQKRQGERKALCYTIRGIKPILKHIGVLHNKYIPDTYLRASWQDRMFLLQGLFDTDGSVDQKNHTCEISTIYPQLRDGIIELLSSLGIKSTYSTKAAHQKIDTVTNKMIEAKKLYRITFRTEQPIASLDRHLQRLGVKSREEQRYDYIVSVEPVDSVPVRCITVDSPDHCFMVTNRFIPTHNSGLMNTGHPDERPEYFPSKRLLVWPDGKAEATIFSADEPDQLRGPQGDTAWADEFASFPGVGGSDGATAFDNLRLAMRLPVPGDMPRMILTTTPRRTKAMFDILDQSERPEFGIVVTKGTTYENLANLADTFRATILGLYEGTRLGQQELMGDMLADIEGALFMPDWFNANRVAELPAGRMYAVVGVDPSVAERPTDECGIVVVKATMEKDFYRRHVYIMEDASVKGSPSVWASRVAAMARKWDAPIVAEGNQGGELVRMAIAQADGNLPVYVVHAKVGKATRAEPVAALAESNRLHIVGSLPELENQAVSWVPAESRYSPDRLDAMVHAVLSVTTRQKGVSFAIGRHLRARSSKSKLPSLNAGSFLRGTGGGRGRRR